MIRGNKHITKNATGLLILTATLLCVLFGQGTHLHDFGIHIGSHFDVHVHLHAHESADEPLETDQNQADTDHRHEVSTADDIIGTLTSTHRLSPNIQSFIVPGLDTGVDVFNLMLQQSPILFDLPPPRLIANQYHFSSFSYRGPPVA